MGKKPKIAARNLKGFIDGANMSLVYDPERPAVLATVIQCKDCKYNPDRDWNRCPMFFQSDATEKDFCSHGDRYEDK